MRSAFASVTGLARLRASTIVRASSAATSAPAAIRIVGVNGSLRKASANAGLLRAAARRLPPGVTFEMADLSGLPLYNDDLWEDKAAANDDSSLPASVRQLRAQIKQADIVLMGCPEYNYSVTSVLKTAIDWGSKGPNVWAGKVTAVVGAGGGAGTARAQAHLLSMSFLGLMFSPYPNGLQVSAFTGMFDKDTGDVVDKDLEDRVAGVVQSAVDFARKLKA